MESYKFPKWIIILLITIPAFFYFWIVSKYTVNAPFWDDYDAILGFLTMYLRDNSLIDKIKLLFIQHNEHRIFLARSISVIYYYLFHEVNFTVLVIIGNLFLVGTFALLYKIFQNEIGLKLIYFIPVSIILFQFQYYSNSIWAMASIQNFGVIFLAFLSLYSLQRKNFIVALMFAILSTYTSGNGLLVFPIGSLYLWLNEKNRKFFYVWCTVSVVTIGLYFVGYKGNPHHPSIWDAILNPINTVKYIVNFTGNYFRVLSKYLALLFSITFFVLTFYVIWKKYYLKTPVTSYFLLFLILSMLLTTASRAGFGADQALSERYRMYSALFAIIIYLLSLIIIENKKYRQILLSSVFVISVINNIYSFTVYHPLIKRHHDALEWSDVKPVYPNVDVAAKTLERSENMGIFSLQQKNKIKDLLYEIDGEIPPSTTKIEHSFEIEETDKFYLITNGWAFNKYSKDTDQDITYIVLRSKKTKYIFKTRKLNRPDVSKNFKRNLDNVGFECVIPKVEMKYGGYSVGILIISSENKMTFLKTDKKIEYTKNNDK